LQGVLALTGQTEEVSMPANQLKRAEQAIVSLREAGELPPKATIALVEVVRNIDKRLTVLEGKGRISPTAEMGLPNRR
jgi:hypothetical protein